MVTLAYTKQKISTGKKNYGGLSGGLNGGISGGLSEQEKELLAIIEKEPGIQIKEILYQLENSPRRTIERQIAQLITRHLIERRGSRKTGGYFVKE